MHTRVYEYFREVIKSMVYEAKLGTKLNATKAQFEVTFGYIPTRKRLSDGKSLNTYKVMTALGS